MRARDLRVFGGLKRCGGFMCFRVRNELCDSESGIADK